MYEKLISDTLVKEIMYCLDDEIDIPDEYIDAFIARTMLAVQKEDRKQISTLYPRLCDSVSDYFRGQQYNEKIWSESEKTDDYIACEEPNNREFVFKMGQLHACTTILNDMIRKLDENETVIANKAYFVKNINFFKAIENKPGINHGELSDAVGKSPSGLTQFVSKIQQYDFFTQTVVGREKYYALTPKGSKLLAELENREQSEMVEFTEDLLEATSGRAFKEWLYEYTTYYGRDEVSRLKGYAFLSEKMMLLVLAAFVQRSGKKTNKADMKKRLVDAYKEQAKEFYCYKPDMSLQR